MTWMNVIPPPPSAGQVALINQATQQVIQAAQQQVQSDATYVQSIAAYSTGIAKLQPILATLPLAPYPPSSDTTNFPQTGTASLRLTPSMVSAAQLAEPGKVTQNLLDQSIARRPKLNVYFAIGAACLAGYFILR